MLPAGLVLVLKRGQLINRSVTSLFFSVVRKAGTERLSELNLCNSFSREISAPDFRKVKTHSLLYVFFLEKIFRVIKKTGAIAPSIKASNVIKSCLRVSEGKAANALRLHVAVLCQQD